MVSWGDYSDVKGGSSVRAPRQRAGALKVRTRPIEPLAPQLARANKKYKCAIDLMYAYAHTPLDEETKLTSLFWRQTFCFHSRLLRSQRTPELLYQTNVNIL